jgi:hypothetical protein
MNVSAPTRGIEYDDIPLYAFERSIDESELLFPSAKNDKCCIQRQLIAKNEVSPSDRPSNHFCASKSPKRGILTHLICPNKNRFKNGNKPLPHDPVLFTTVIHTNPTPRATKLTRALTTTVTPEDHPWGICCSQIGIRSPDSAAMEILNMKKTPVRTTGQTFLLKAWFVRKESR